MSIQVTVWNEFRHERNDEKVRAVYPEGLHKVIGDALGEDARFSVRLAALDDPEQGLPEEVAEFADALEETGCVLERSEPYANRGASRYVRVYIDAEKRAADGGAREIEEV